MTDMKNSFGTRLSLDTEAGPVTYYSLEQFEKTASVDLLRMPVTIKLFLENLLRAEDAGMATTEDVGRMSQWGQSPAFEKEYPFMPSRVLLQDFTGVPAIVDLAAMRDAAERLYGDAMKINPVIPSELVIDHSVQVDHFRGENAFEQNTEKEFERNGERYAFLRWGQQNFSNFSVVPPATGICHQVNLEYLASVVTTRKINGQRFAFPDTLVGLDSHTTMVNGIGVLGWGVGGIEAEAVMLGRPYYILTPQVVGFRLFGKRPEQTTATDLVLTITELLRKKGVVGKYVEFYGSGLKNLSAEDRATISNMAPEYGATTGFFPVDEKTLRYLKLTGRSEKSVSFVETYLKAQGLFRTDETPDPIFTDSVEFDMSTIEPSLAGPSRPQQRVSVFKTPPVVPGAESESVAKPGKKTIDVHDDGKTYSLSDGSVVIAAITSCTNTSNPSVLIGAGLLAQKAVRRGLTVKPWVKTSLAPGSKAVLSYLDAAGLLDDLTRLGFQHVAYGCTTCIGNSGPLSDPITAAITENNLTVASVLSGNRNFEGRIHPHVKASFLASPIFVIAYAISGRIDIDLTTEPLGVDSAGQPVYLKEIWPSREEIDTLLKKWVKPEIYQTEYASVYEGSGHWKSLPTEKGAIYQWDDSSTYIKEPPFFRNLTRDPSKIQDIKGARILALLGHSVTTDHISPAGAIPENSPAGTYLADLGIQPSDFNSYGSRRGNHEVMMRGTFGNIRLKNKLTPEIDGGWTKHFPEGRTLSIYDAAMQYQAEKIPLVVLAGKEYGAGSSRDWAAKGTFLLGVKAVIAESYERIHRSNLVCMGVLPLQFKPGESYDSLNLDGTEVYNISGIAKDFKPGEELSVAAQRENGERIEFKVIARIDSPVELTYYRHGGILAYVLRDLH